MRIAPPLALLALASLHSCSASRYVFDVTQSYIPPATPDQPRNATTVKGEEFDALWERVIAFFATNQIPIDTLEKASGIVVAKRIVTSLADAATFADLGQIRTTAQQVREDLSPAQFEGSANASIVRATGNVTSRSNVGEPLVFNTKADYRLSIAFNVFVRRFAGGDAIEVAINSSVAADERITLVGGTTRWSPSKIENVDVAWLLKNEPLRQGAPAQPLPRSTGAFEKMFIQHVESGARR